MNPQIQSEKPIEIVNNVETATEQDALTQSGFSSDEIVCLALAPPVVSKWWE